MDSRLAVLIVQIAETDTQRQAHAVNQAHSTQGGGAEKVLEVASEVLSAAGVEPEYLALRGRDLGEPPAEGDARLSSPPPWVECA